MLEVFRQIARLIKLKNVWLGLFILKAGIAIFLALAFYLANNSYLSTSLYSKGLIRAWDFTS